jgi:hypothetical protein
MILYTNPEEANIQKIPDVDLQYLADQLELFVKTYREEVCILKPEYFTILSHLEEISHRLKNRQYETLIGDTSIISYEENIPNTWFEYDDYDYPF